jgi:hypothetical protein
MNGNDEVKKTLALIILRHVDQGECNSERLADVALREWTGADRSEIGDHSATATGLAGRCPDDRLVCHRRDLNGRPIQSIEIESLEPTNRISPL